MTTNYDAMCDYVIYIYMYMLVSGMYMFHNVIKTNRAWVVEEYNTIDD